MFTNVTPESLAYWQHRRAWRCRLAQFVYRVGQRLGDLIDPPGHAGRK